MKKLLGLLALAASAAIAANGVSPKDTQDPVYQIKRLDDPTLKGYLGSSIKAAGVKIGVFDASDSDYSGGVPGTYDLQDAITGEKLVIPAGTVITQVMAYTPTTLLTGSTISVGYSGSTAALLAARATSSMTTGTILDGVPVSTAATSIARTADTDLSVTISGATVSSGKSYFLIRAAGGMQ